VGIVIRQGLKTTVLQYIGVGVGLVANLFLYTRAREAYGAAQVFIAAANVFAPFAMLGAYSLVVRFYPRFGPEAEKQGFLTLLLGITTAGTGLYLLLSPLLQDFLLNTMYPDLDPEFRPLLRYLPGLVALLAYTKIFYQYAVNFRRLFVPVFFEQFVLKFTLPAAILAYYLGYIGAGGILAAIFINYSIAVLGIAAYLWRLGKLKLRPITAELWASRGELANYAAYGLAGMVGGTLAFRIDTLMVAAYLDLASAGTYTVLLFMSEVIAKPYTSLHAVLAPEVAEAWARKDMSALGELYKRSSINFLLVSLYVFGGIVVCYTAVTEMASEGEALLAGFSTFLALGISRLVNAGTSINEYVISYSSKYRVNLIATLVLAVLNVILNVLLIPRFGLLGAGLATLASTVIFHGGKVAYAYAQFGIQPFTRATWSLLLVCTLLAVAVYALPSAGEWWLDVGLKGGLYSLGVLAVVMYMKPSIEAERLVRQGFAKLGIGSKLS